jgi:hypothetical protein
MVAQGRPMLGSTASKASRVGTQSPSINSWYPESGTNRSRVPEPGDEAVGVGGALAGDCVTAAACGQRGSPGKPLSR